jgi:hypothetical protein
MRDATLDDPAGPGGLIKAAWCLIVIAICGVAAVWHITGHTIVSLEKLAAFEEIAPFQYRVLVPALVRVAHDVSGWPVFRLYAVTEWAGWVVLVLAAQQVVGMLEPRPGWLTTRLVALTAVVAVGAQLIAPVRFRAFQGDTLVGDVNSLLHGGTTALRTVPNVYYPWDIWSAALLLVLIAAAIRVRRSIDVRSLATYAACFTVAALNRETTILIVPFSLWALAPRVTRPQLAGYAAVQVVLWIMVRAAVVWVTGAPPNPKSTLTSGAEWYLWTNLRTATYPLYVVTVLVPFAGGAWLPLLAWWSDRPPLARALLVWYVVPAAAIAFVFGIFHETRVFTEAATATWLASAATVHAHGIRVSRMDHA